MKVNIRLRNMPNSCESMPYLAVRSSKAVQLYTYPLYLRFRHKQSPCPAGTIIC